MDKSLIFLNIDGVLNTQKSQDSWKDDTWEFVKFDKSSSENFHKLMESVDCDIVLIDRTWIKDFSLKETVKIFHRYTLHKEGTEYCKLEISEKGKRKGPEILKYLESYPEYKSYLVIDHDDSEIKQYIPEENFLHVKAGWFRGLSKDNIDQAMVKLSLQKSKLETVNV